MLKSVLGQINDFAERVTGLRFQPSADNRLDSARANIFNQEEINLVVDVGANRGQWVSRIRKMKYRGKIISFEPSEAFLDLSKVASTDNNWEIRNIALGKTHGVLDLYESSNKQLSSSLRSPSGISSHRPDITFSQKRRVSVSTLVTQIDPEAANIYLKIDTQGFEMDVLIGAEELLTRVVAIEFESALRPMYLGETLHYDIAEWLRNHGFVSRQLVVTDWDSTLNTIAMDSIFVRSIL